jgi:hypothetical protein
MIACVARKLRALAHFVSGGDFLEAGIGVDPYPQDFT